MSLGAEYIRGRRTDECRNDGKLNRLQLSAMHVYQQYENRLSDVVYNVSQTQRSDYRPQIVGASTRAGERADGRLE